MPRPPIFKTMRLRVTGVLVLALLIVPGAVVACGSLWVSIEGGESKLGGSYRSYVPAAVYVSCGENAELDIIEQTGKFARSSGSVRIGFDGSVLALQIGLVPYYFNIPPNGTPIQVGLDDGRTFRGGAVLTAIQQVSPR